MLPSDTNQVVIISGSNGEFKSPHYPSNYPDDTECVWRILGGPEKVITVSFLDFSLEDESNCEYDAVRAYAGDGTSAPEIFE